MVSDQTGLSGLFERRNMTYAELMRRTWLYNQSFILAITALLCFAVLALIAAIVCILSGHVVLFACGLAIAAWTGHKAYCTSPAETREEALCRYINHLLKKAAQKKHRSLIEEDEKANAGISIFERKRHRVLRIQAFNLAQDIQESLAEVAEELKTCEATLRRMQDHKSVTAAEIKGFEYELDILEKKARKAVYNHYANPKNSQGSDLAEYVDGLRKSASEL